MLFTNVLGPSRTAESHAKHCIFLKLKPGVDEHDFVNERVLVSALQLVTPERWQKVTNKPLIVQIAEHLHHPEGIGRAIVLPFDFEKPQADALLVNIDDDDTKTFMYTSRIDHAEEVIIARRKILHTFDKHSQMFLDFDILKVFPLMREINSIIPNNTTPPLYSPPPPTCRPRSPTYIPKSPTYIPKSPTYLPGSPNYLPGSPTYIPKSPTYIPKSPKYLPGSPNY